MRRAGLAIVLVLGIGVASPGPAIGSTRTGGVIMGLAVPTFQGPYQIFKTNQSEFFPPTENSGWWSWEFDNYNKNDNYYVGSQSGPDDTRDFFTFDLSPLGGTVVRAELIVTRFHMQSDDATETFEIHDVSTDAFTLNRNVGVSTDIWTDLGTGVLYGSYDVPGSAHGEVLRFELNESAVADINAAAGGFFSLGGALPTSDPGEAMFSYSTHVGPQWLVVQLAE